MHAPATQSSRDSALTPSADSPFTNLKSETSTPLSGKRQAANRANAQHSTGPRTAQGKSNSSKNALRHGAYAQSTLLPDDDPKHLLNLRAQFLQTLSPQTEFELYLAERAVSLAWRLQRFTQASADLHNVRNNSLTCDFDDSYIDLTKAEDRLQSMLHRTLKQLQNLQKQRQENPPPPCPFLQSESENQQNQATQSASQDPQPSPAPPAPEIARNEPTTPAPQAPSTDSAPENACATAASTEKSRNEPNPSPPPQPVTPLTAQETPPP